MYIHLCTVYTYIYIYRPRCSEPDELVEARILKFTFRYYSTHYE